MIRPWKEIPKAEQATIVAEARELVGFLSWNALARKYQTGVAGLRSALDPAFRTHQNKLRRHWHATSGGYATNHQAEHRVPERDVAARLAEIPDEDTRDLTGRLFGDPIPGRTYPGKRTASPRGYLSITPAERRRNRNVGIIAAYRDDKRGMAR